MKLRIDPERCTGHGRCYVSAPDLVDCDDEGYGQVAVEAVPEDQLEAARKAVVSCPERAVTLE